ncbi:hypothetical protein [Nannocystis pusilla]|uniref:hypothetical protein n=1 Tax=Nannocystis pusilla TaxID=889268 RepID=UPI003DA2ABC6
MSAFIAFTGSALLGLFAALAPELPVTQPTDLPAAEPGQDLPKNGPPVVTDCDTDCGDRCTWDVCPHPLGCYAALDEGCHATCVAAKQEACVADFTAPD